MATETPLGQYYCRTGHHWAPLDDADGVDEMKRPICLGCRKKATA